MQEHKAELGKDFDTAKYIAGGIAVFDLHTHRMKWTQHLDLSTDHTQFRAYLYSSPTLADIDADGKLEIIVGTSMVRSKISRECTEKSTYRESQLQKSVQLGAKI